MKKYKWFSAIIIFLFLLQIFNSTAFANSSWFWISETRPYDVLPCVAIGTIIVETISLITFAKIKRSFEVFATVTIANAISFAAPYLYELLIHYSEKMPYEMYLENWPSYTVGILFCIATVLIELPIVYFSLREKAISRKKIIVTIIITNIVTTILVAIIERIFCVGTW